MLFDAKLQECLVSEDTLISCALNCLFFFFYSCYITFLHCDTNKVR